MDYMYKCSVITTKLKSAKKVFCNKIMYIIYLPAGPSVMPMVCVCVCAYVMCVHTYVCMRAFVIIFILLGLFL